VSEYFIFGAGFYVGMCSMNPVGFVEAPLVGIIRGLLIGFVLWPVGLIWNVVVAIDELKDRP
jgi:hypothetical protein